VFARRRDDSYRCGERCAARFIADSANYEFSHADGCLSSGSFHGGRIVPFAWRREFEFGAERQRKGRGGRGEFGWGGSRQRSTARRRGEEIRDELRTLPSIPAPFSCANDGDGCAAHAGAGDDHG
jgi:hypothetical protein